MENKTAINIILNKVSYNRFCKIKEYALYYRQIFENGKKYHQCSLHLPLNHNAKSRKAPNRILKPITGFAQTLENYITDKANAKNIELYNEDEKNIFICNGIFPNDEKFLNTLAEHDFLNIFDEFIEIYFYIDEKYKNNETLSKMQKCLQYKKLMKVHSNEIVEIQNYFYKFHCITDINLIINKLLQIYYFNRELYNSYVETDEDKKTNQKIK